MSEKYEINFDDFFEPEEECDEDYEYVDQKVLKKLQRSSMSIERIQKDIFNFNEKGEVHGEKATRKFEFQIQANRVLQIFDEMINKIETLLCIQAFTEDRQLMEKYFTGEEIASLQRYCSRSKEVELDFTEPEESENVQRCIQLILNSDLYLHTDDYKDNISLQKKIFLNNIRELRNIINSRLHLIAPKEMRKEQILHQMWKKYEKTKEKIQTIKERWLNRKQAFEEKMASKYETIDRMLREIDLLRDQNEVEIFTKIQQSNTNMINFCKLKDMRIETAFEEAEESKNQYEKLLTDDLDTEEMYRNEKIKAIQSLQNILNKFDVEVTDRTAELEQLTIAYEKQKEAFEEWKATVFEPQEKKHIQSMIEKEEDEKRQQQEAMMLFMMNRSAKILQKYWRTMCLRRKKKGKGKNRGRKK